MKKGFTLAEVLITLGIVGIVAVLTIPAVMKNYKNRLYTAQLEKVYAQISDAATAVMNDEHVDNFYETTAGQANACSTDGQTCTAGIGYFLTKYFKSVKKDCVTGDDSCVAGTAVGSYQKISGANAGGFDENDYCIQTASGASICGKYVAAPNKCMSIAVDVNGQAEPNIVGRDVFAMDIHKDGSISDYNSNCADNNFGCNAEDCNNRNGTNVYTTSCGCLNSIIDAGWKMEY